MAAMGALLTILSAVLLVGIAVALCLQHKLLSRLRVQHPIILACLNESSAGIMAFQRYLWKRQYVGLEDEAFTRRADALRRFWKICFLLFLLVAVAVVGAIALKK